MAKLVYEDQYELLLAQKERIGQLSRKSRSRSAQPSFKTESYSSKKKRGRPSKHELSIRAAEANKKSGGRSKSP